MALDTETTGLRIFARGFQCRLVQFGSETEAWVLRADRWRSVIQEALRREIRWVCHNAPFDLLVLDATGLASLDVLGPRVFDTYILAHLCDPRTESDGGPGLGLKPLSTIYVDNDAQDTAKGLYEVFRREYKATKATGWALIDVGHPLYVTYAGLDVVYTARLLRELSILIRQSGLSDLAQFEHRVQLFTTHQQRRGLRVDVDYTTGLRSSLSTEADDYRSVAAGYGVDNINSTRQVIAALEGMGEVWSEKTATGNPAVGKDVLLPMADLDRDWKRLHVRDEPNPLADAIIRSKRAMKWSESYVVPFLEDRDEGDRIHPFIKSLAARTARMSVSNPPLQQLPSSDWTIRRCIVADPGQTIVAADYSAVEMRVLAALADVKVMKRLISEGADLHAETARLVYGAEWDLADDKAKKRMRGLMKGVGFGKVYGGGPTGLARQTGPPLRAGQARHRRLRRRLPGGPALEPPAPADGGLRRRGRGHPHRPPAAAGPRPGLRRNELCSPVHRPRRPGPSPVPH